MLQFNEVKFTLRSRMNEEILVVVAEAREHKAFVEWYLDGPARWPNDDLMFELRMQAFYKLRILVPKTVEKPSE